jgi:hypothetical protein
MAVGKTILLFSAVVPVIEKPPFTSSGRWNTPSM